MAESFGVSGRGNFYEETGAIRDGIQNHLVQVVALIAMEPPTSMYPESVRDEQVKVFRNIPLVQADKVVRGLLAIAMSRGWLRIRRWKPLRVVGAD